MSNRAVKVIVPLHATWQGWWDDQGSDNDQHDEDLECTFVAIERGGYWALANGFFWPEGAKYLPREGP
jgi:hypothetical protein